MKEKEKKEKVKWTALRVKRRLRDYLDGCEAAEYYPTDYDLMKLFGISARQLDYWVSGGKTERVDYAEFAPVMKELVAYREHCLVRKLLSDPKGASGTIFALKQKKNGGYTDKQESEIGGAIQIDVKLQGGGADPFG